MDLKNRRLEIIDTYMPNKVANVELNKTATSYHSMNNTFIS